MTLTSTYMGDLGAFWSASVATRALSDNPVIDSVTGEPRHRLSWSAAKVGKVVSVLKPIAAGVASVWLTPAAGAAIYAVDEVARGRAAAQLAGSNDQLVTFVDTAPLENLHAFFRAEVQARMKAKDPYETDDAIRALLKRGRSLGPTDAFCVGGLLSLVAWKYGAPAFEAVIRGKWSDHGAYSDAQVQGFLDELKRVGASYRAAHPERIPTFTGQPMAGGGGRRRTWRPVLVGLGAGFVLGLIFIPRRRR